MPLSETLEKLATLGVTLPNEIRARLLAALPASSDALTALCATHCPRWDGAWRRAAPATAALTRCADVAASRPLDAGGARQLAAAEAAGRRPGGNRAVGAPAHHFREGLLRGGGARGCARARARAAAAVSRGLAERAGQQRTGIERPARARPRAAAGLADGAVLLRGRAAGEAASVPVAERRGVGGPAVTAGGQGQVRRAPDRLAHGRPGLHQHRHGRAAAAAARGGGRGARRAGGASRD